MTPPQHRSSGADLPAGRPCRICSSRFRHARRRAGDRGIDLRRCTDQRHTAVFARAVSGVRRGLPARDRAAGAAGLDARVGSVASVFVSRWDRAVSDKAPDIAQPARHRNSSAHLPCVSRAAGIAALAQARTAGAQPQRLLWGSTGPRIRRHRPRCMSRRLPPRHDQHDARKDIACVCRARSVAWRDARGRRRRRRCLHALLKQASTLMPCQPAAERGRAGVRQVVERAAQAHRRKKRSARRRRRAG